MKPRRNEEATPGPPKAHSQSWSASDALSRVRAEPHSDDLHATHRRRSLAAAEAIGAGRRCRSSRCICRRRIRRSCRRGCDAEFRAPQIACRPARSPRPQLLNRLVVPRVESGRGATSSSTRSPRKFGHTQRSATRDASGPALKREQCLGSWRRPALGLRCVGGLTSQPPSPRKKCGVHSPVTSAPAQACYRSNHSGNA